MRLPCIALAGSLAVCSFAHGARARAYTISSVISYGCHERITAEALRSVRLELPSVAPIAATREERALIADLPFEVPDDMDDLAGVTLLVAVRDNDLKGRFAADLAHLPLVHGDPAAQREHCLRAPHERDPGGAEAALMACRAFIRERFEQALDGLDEEGRPDPAQRTVLPLYLALRHSVDAPLPTFYVRMGQALHTIEDSFTHTFRSADGKRVVTVGNWINHVEKTLDPETDGPAHRGELDQCDKLDDLREQRKALAGEAATRLLRSALDPALTRAEKLAAADALLDEFLSYEPGCNYDNDWCDAPERKYGDKNAIKCALGRGAPDLSLWPLLLFLALRAGWLRRRALFALLIALAIEPQVANAQEKSMFEAREVEKRRASTDADDTNYIFGGSLALAGAVDHGAGAVALGARLRLHKNWICGFDAEWNPWISDPRVIYNAEHFRAGVFNGYASAIFRIPLGRENFNLRSTLSLGFSTMLMDLYGAPRGATGLYGAFTPLGLEWKMASIPYLIVNPLSIALAAPQLNGVPFVYAQYRFTIAVELYADKPPRWLRKGS